MYEKMYIYSQKMRGGQLGDKMRECEYVCVCVCEGQMLALPQGTVWKRWSSVERSVSRTRQRMRESGAGKSCLCLRTTCQHSPCEGGER